MRRAEAHVQENLNQGRAGEAERHPAPSANGKSLHPVHERRQTIHKRRQTVYKGDRVHKGELYNMFIKKNCYEQL